jgi:hypothetical protein
MVALKNHMVLSCNLQIEERLSMKPVCLVVGAFLREIADVIGRQSRN